MLTVVTWKWQKPGYRTTFTADHVNAMREMVARHYPDPHRFVCVTDDPSGLEPGIEPVELWRDYMEVESPHGRDQPGCYVRMKAFDPETAKVFGERFVSIDLDAVIVDDLRPLWNRPEPFVIWFHRIPGPTANGPRNRFQGSMWMVQRGAHPEAWTRFKGAESALEAYRAGFHGSDQGWLNYIIGEKKAAFWRATDGIWSYSYELRHSKSLPTGSRVVFFHGVPKPWDADVMANTKNGWWIRERYPLARVGVRQ